MSYRVTPQKDAKKHGQSPVLVHLLNGKNEPCTPPLRCHATPEQVLTLQVEADCIAKVRWNTKNYKKIIATRKEIWNVVG
jgi:hypothetical protein